MKNLLLYKYIIFALNCLMSMSFKNWMLVAPCSYILMAKDVDEASSYH